MNLNMFEDMSGAWLNGRGNSGAFAPAPDNTAGAVSRFPAQTPLGMAYVPFQQWGEVYPDDDAFVRGTLFPQLDYPFKGGCCDE